MSFYQLIVAVLILIVTTTLSFALEAYPDMECVFNDDKSRILINVSNGGDQNYICLAECRYKISGARPIEHLDCRLSLSAGTQETTKCDIRGDGPNYFSEILAPSMTCQPS